MLAFYLFFPTCLINSIKHEHSCKILYLKHWFVLQATITQADGRPVISTDKDVRVVTYIKFYDHNVHKDRAHSLPDVMYAPPPTGMLEIDVDPPSNAKSLHLEVSQFFT